MKNIFYFHSILKIGGIESFFYYLCKKYKDWDIDVYYTVGDEEQIKRLKKYVRVIQYEPGTQIYCEKAFFNFNTDIIENVHAKEYSLILHGDYKAMVNSGQLSMSNLPRHPKINKYYGVSQLVCDSFTELTGIPTTVIYNPIEFDKPKRILNLISATRLSKEKGRWRMIKLAEALDKANIPYTWTIYTNSKDIIKNPNIVYKEPTLDILPCVSKADYLVQLSDNEGYCYSVVEALSLGTPVIVTDLPVFEELGLNTDNSIKLPLDMKNIPVGKIYNTNFNFKYIPKEDNWDKLLAPGVSSYQEELNSVYTVEALPAYQNHKLVDIELNRIPQPGEVWDVSKERFDLLAGENKRNIPFVRLVDKKPISL